MSHIFKLFFLKATILLFALTNAIANSNVSQAWTYGAYGTPTVFKVKPLSMELCESFDVSTGICNGANDVTFTPNVTEDNGRCDLAGVAPGAVACTAAGTNGIPKNVTFNYMKATISRTMWLTGSVEPKDANGDTIQWQNNSNYNGNLSQCVTSSSNTNTNGSSAPLGATTGTPSEQAIYFMNGPGNDDYSGNASTSSWSEARGNSQDNPQATPDWNAGCGSNDFTTFQELEFVSVTPLDSAGYDSATTSSCGDYSYYNDYSGVWQEDGTGNEITRQIIWQSGLSSSDEGLVMIYKLTSPYTRTSDTPPTLRMAFDVTGGLRAQFAQYTADEDPSPGTEFCTIDVGRPSVTITISD